MRISTTVAREFNNTAAILNTRRTPVRLGLLSVRRWAVLSLGPSALQSDLGLALGAAARLDPLGDGAVQVVLGDPALVVLLAAGDAGGLGAREGLDLEGLLDQRLLLGRLGALSLREEGLDPGLVDKVEGAAEDARQEEVEEDAGDWLAFPSRKQWQRAREERGTKKGAGRGFSHTSGDQRSWWAGRRCRPSGYRPGSGIPGPWRWRRRR